MSCIRLITAGALWIGLALPALADAPMVHCTGSICGGAGPRAYTYPVDSASYPMMEFRVGTNDLDPAHYLNVLVPPGWQFAVEEIWMSHLHAIHTPHGQDSPGPCWCLTAGSAHWWTDDPALAIEAFTFGYDHSWPPEDVGWELTTRREGPPPEYYVFNEAWDALVGFGYGPLHGPSPGVSCWSDNDCPEDHYCFFEDCLVETGVCLPRPLGCPDIWDPVCGCDGLTYANACDAAGAGASIAYYEACLAGDLDVDHDVDLADYAMFHHCLTGPGGGIPLPCAAADLNRDVHVDLRDFQIFQIAFTSSVPWLVYYGNTGCLEGTSGEPDGGWYPCGDDEIQLTVEDDTLHVVHRNATYNCCPDDIIISLSVEGTVLTLTETEILSTPCDCLCCYDVSAAVDNLAPGEYTVVFCWEDYETGQQQCHEETIVIPEPVPYVADYANSGCLRSARDDLDPCPEDDAIELIVEGNSFHVTHTNATYNCCPDEIAISLAVEGDLLRLTETEILVDPCFCICCYEVEATVVDLPPGEYTVEYCWFDYETYEERCHIENIVIQ